jgi:hypothetical protein
MVAGMPEYLNAIDVCNRAMQYLGAKRIDPQLGFTEISVQASECSFAYGKLRQAELRRNVWTFAIRRSILRPVNLLAVQGSTFVTNPANISIATSPTMLLAPALYSSTTTYSSGALCIDAAGTIWQSLAPANLNAAPGNSSTWDEYAGPLTVDAYVSGTSYLSGELAYVAPGDGSYTVYQSIVEGNSDNPATASAYSATQVYAKDEVVTSASILYQSLVDLNYGHTPASSPTQWTTTITSGSGSVKWRTLAAALQQIVTPYPVGAGPASQATTRNAYRKPCGFLREAPQDPKAGGSSDKGAPTGLLYSDWTYDGPWLITRDGGPILYRYVADITNVTSFDPMFVEALAARIAYAVCEPVTQSTAKQQACLLAHKQALFEAGMVNGIEQGSVEPPIDDFIATRF